MSIRPIDMQVMVQKSSDVHRLQQDGQRPEVAQQQFAERLQKEVKQSDHHVSESFKADKRQVDKDGRGNSGGGGGRKGKKGGEGKPGEEKTKKASLSMFDISV